MATAKPAGTLPTLTTLTRKQAQEHSTNLNRVRAELVTQIRSIERKRTWTPEQKLRAKSAAERTLFSITNLNDMLCQHYGIGGY